MGKELERAFSVVMEESVRNAMVSAFQRLDMWPPRPTPAGVCMEDCSYEDVSAPLAVVAQRAYNDELRRARDAAKAQQARFHDFALRAAELERQQQEEHERQRAQQDELPCALSERGCHSDFAAEAWPALVSNSLSPKGILAKAKALLLSSAHTQPAG